MARGKAKTAKTAAAQLPALPAEVESLLAVLLAVRLRRALITAPAPSAAPLPVPATSTPRYTGETGNAVSRQRRRGRGGAR